MCSVRVVYSAQITLAWDANSEPDIAGYKIYYGTTSRIYDLSVEVGSYTSVTIADLIEGETYYFAATAYDADGNESDFSNEVVHNISEKKGDWLLSGLGSTGGGWIEIFDHDYNGLDWLQVDWPSYNAANGETRIATGDIDGDGKDEIIIGLGPVSIDTSIPGGRFLVLDDDYSSLAWGQTQRSAYNSANGETWPACGDVDGDGKDEIIIGLGSYPAAGGFFEVFAYESETLLFKTSKHVQWAAYNNANGETRPACGDVDGDGKDEIIIGLGQGGGGWLEVFDDAASGYAHLAWPRVAWDGYNSANGETRPACGDVDGDGKDEIIIGLGQGGGGWLEVLDDAARGYAHLAWPRVAWDGYNSANGETRPACGDVDGDGKDEIIIGLGQGGGGWLEVFDDASSAYAHLAWPRVDWTSYNSVNGETRPAVIRR
jgi:hypothetical protein